MRGILFRLAALGSLVSGGAACAGSRPVGSGPLNPAPAAGGTIPFASALILGTGGSTPPDTSVTFPAGERRIVVLRYAPPDNNVFATLEFPPTAFASGSGTISVRLHARPGVYGLDIETSSSIGRGATVTFEYPRHFSAPPDARRLYGSDAAYERTLAVTRLAADSTLAIITSTRPAPDHLKAPLPSAGTYYVAAPR